MIIEYLKLFYVFFKIGIVGFGGGYAMLSMIMTESQQFGVTLEQLADLNALDMVVPGPLAINAATYVGYLHAGVWGAVAATAAMLFPSFIIITLVMRVMDRFRQNHLLNNFLAGVKPAAVGLIGAAAMTIASGVLLRPGAGLSTLFVDPLGTLALLPVAAFVITAVANIRFRVNPILLTALAGIAGALLAR